jgi:CHASE1-domain containing sensor protein
MSERWVPLLAAVVGLLGGMGGAYVGGTVANEGQQDRFEDERKAEMRTYG